jgi:hypothetical protein
MISEITCVNCEHYVICDDRDKFDFCENCTDYGNCSIESSETCLAGYGIECNNGFEPRSSY